MSKSNLHKIIRVDHAGELGAKWIYEGQLRWIKDPIVKAEIQHMYEQEQIHLEYFEKMIKDHHIRPTALMPLWKWVGRTAGAVSAAFGSKAAMACTEAVEDVIDNHYAEQIQGLELNHPEELELIKMLKTFREDECNHRDMAADYDQNPTMGKTIAKKMIKFGVKVAIKMSKRV